MSGVLSAIGNAAPAISMLAVFALLVGGAFMLRHAEERQKGWLMIALAIVIFANVLIWTI